MPSGEDKLTMTVKAAISDTEPVIVKTLGNGITNKDGVCELHIEPQDTRHLQCGVYVYDVELIMDGGYTDTIIPPSKFVITAEVTTHD